MVAGRDVGDAVARRRHDAGAFMAENARQRGGDGARHCVPVAGAYPGRFDAHLHLAWPGWRQVHIDDAQFIMGGEEHGSLHAQLLKWVWQAMPQADLRQV